MTIDDIVAALHALTDAELTALSRRIDIELVNRSLQRNAERAANDARARTFDLARRRARDLDERPRRCGADRGR